MRSSRNSYRRVDATGGPDSHARVGAAPARFSPELVPPLWRSGLSAGELTDDPAAIEFREVPPSFGGAFVLGRALRSGGQPNDEPAVFLAPRRDVVQDTEQVGHGVQLWADVEDVSELGCHLGQLLPGDSLFGDQDDSGFAVSEASEEPRLADTAAAVEVDRVTAR